MYLASVVWNFCLTNRSLGLTSFNAPSLPEHFNTFRDIQLPDLVNQESATET